MLANDANKGKRSSAFSIVAHAHEAVAELMAECPQCGAFTLYGLELAWRLRTLKCKECSCSMRLDESDLNALREQLIATRIRIDRLMNAAQDQE